MESRATKATNRSRGRLAQVGVFVRTVCMVGGAIIAVVAGVSTLNMVSANYGMATLNEIASPYFQHFARLGRQG